jgi:hypothetical protein
MGIRGSCKKKNNEFDFVRITSLSHIIFSPKHYDDNVYLHSENIIYNEYTIVLKMLNFTAGKCCISDICTFLKPMAHFLGFNIAVDIPFSINLLNTIMQQSTFPIIMNLLLHSSHFCVTGAASF